MTDFDAAFAACTWTIVGDSSMRCDRCEHFKVVIDDSTTMDDLAVAQERHDAEVHSD